MRGEDDTQGDNPVQRVITRAGVWAAWPYLVFAILLIVAIVALGGEVHQHIKAIESWIARLGPWAVLAFVGLFIVATSLLVPDTLLSMIAGALFGMTWGVAAVVGGNLMACSLQYALARRLLRRWVEQRLAAKPSLAAIQRAVIRDELRLQVLVRMTPLNPATISYLLGAAGVRFPGFFMACFITTAHLIIEVYFGYAGKHVVKMAGGGAHAGRLHDVVTIGGAVVGVIIVVLVWRIARKALIEAVAEAESLPPDHTV